MKNLYLFAIRKSIHLIVLVTVTGNLWAGELPFGRKVRLVMKTGQTIEGVLIGKMGDQEVGLEGSKKMVPLYDIEKVVILKKSDPEKEVTLKVVQEESLPTPPMEKQSPPMPDSKNASKQSQKTIHRLTPASFAVGNNSSFGIEIAGYELVFPSGVGLRITPLSAYGYSKKETQVFSFESGYSHYLYISEVTRESIYWAPVWVRYYFRQTGDVVWPYLGTSVAVHSYSEDKFTTYETSIKPAGELGIDIGGRVYRFNVGGKFFLGGSDEGKSLSMFAAGLSIRLGGRGER